MDNVELYIREGVEESTSSYILIDKLYDEVVPTFSKRLGKRQFYKVLVEVAGQCGPLVQVQHKAALTLCVAGGVTAHPYSSTCCDNPTLGSAHTYRVMTNCKWVS